MKTVLFPILFFAILFSAQAQTDNKIVIGSIDSLQSNILKEQRKVWVYVPENDGQNDIYAQQRYPVVYLLDGDAHFASVVGMIQNLSSSNGNTICPKMIVVGIPNTNRMRDLSPTHVDADPPMNAAMFVNTGGGENFTAFLEKELMPYIDSKYPTEPYKMLIGHSLGGLFAINTLIHHTDLFNAYVAIDPSMWWDKFKLVKASEKALAERTFNGKTLYLGIANTMEEGMDIKNAPQDTSWSTRHIRSILELDQNLKANSKNGLKYQSKYYENDSHGSVPLITEYDALRFIFDIYNLKLSAKDKKDTTAALVNVYVKHYENVSELFGYKVNPPEDLINGMGYNALGKKYYEQAAGFFKLNVVNYPESSNVYDSYGDYFIEIGDTANAIANLQKALSIKENSGSRQKLEALQEK